MTPLAGTLAALGVIAAFACAAVALGLLWQAVVHREERATGCAIVAAGTGLFWAAAAAAVAGLLHL